VHVSVHRDDATGAATLMVADDGPGIPAADRAHVFERFYRGQASRTTAGSGIGLAVVEQLVKAHGGTVVLLPAQEGACFAVTLPAAPASRYDPVVQ